MPRPTTRQRLVALYACAPALRWIGRRSLPQAWRECQHGDWMAWLLAHAEPVPMAADRIAAWALDCAERALPIFERVRPGDSRPRRAIDVARAYLRGEATRDELAAARASAWASAKDAAEAAAGSAAWAAWAAAVAAESARWAACTAGAAARAATRAADAARAADATEAAWQADRLREYLPTLPRGMRLRGEGE